MSWKVFRAVRYGSLPVVGLSLPLLHLRAESNVETMSFGSKMVKPKSLSIYGEPQNQPEYQLIPEGQSKLRDSVSVVRKYVWKFSDTFQGAVKFTKKTYQVSEETFHDVVKYIKTEEGFYPRAGLISIAGLTGLVLARRGGVIKKVVYSGGLMTAMASLCYPYKAVRIAEAEWNYVKQVYKDKISTPTPAVDKVPTLDTPEGASKTDEAEKVAETADKKSDTTETSNDPSLVDHGQSKPEDRDLYTTRS